MTKLAFTPGEGGGRPAKPEAEESQPPIPNDIVTFVPPLPAQQTPIPLPQPESPHDYADQPVSPPPPQPTPPAEQSAEQEASSDSGEQGDTGSDDTKNEKKPHNPASSQPSTPDLPPDIEWSPEDEASGLLPSIQAAAAGTRDGSEDKTTAVCEALYAADPEGVARGLKFMTG